MYAAGTDCLRVDEGVMGDKNESVKRADWFDNFPGI
jgi:hypothetical protein